MKIEVVSNIFRAKRLARIGILAGSLFAVTGSARAVDVMVTFTNLAPGNGLWIMQPWVGFSNGSYDPFNVGAVASPGLQSVAEDGVTGILNTQFQTAFAGNVSGQVGMGPTAPGLAQSRVFSLDPLSPNSRFMAYTMMVIPGNDGFVGSDNPLSHPIFDLAGNFVATDFLILGSDVLDAGTEINDELPANTAFFGQMAPNTGVDQNGVIAVHPGFNAPGSGGILDAAMFANANFKLPGYQVASVSFRVVPEPSDALLAGLGSLCLLRRRRASVIG